MIIVQKKQNQLLKAYELGQHTEKEIELINNSLEKENNKENIPYIKELSSDKYEIKTQESVNGIGSIAKKGDYFKLDNSGYPYPNDREWFLKNHKQIDYDQWKQIAHPLKAYILQTEMDDTIKFLINSGKMTINENNPNKYFNAELWGSLESAKNDAVVVIYGETKDEADNIIDVDFNFVAKDEFDKTHNIVSDKEKENLTVKDNKKGA